MTQLLNGASHGDERAASRLLPLVYEELRRLAAGYLSQERAGHTLQATALVHEAFIRLVGSDDARWQDRAHFYRVAALAMRRVLVNHARDRVRLKRGGSGARVSLDSDPADLSADPNELLGLDEALNKLARLDERKVQIVQLRYFGGFTIDQTAEIMELSPAQVKRDWTNARAFLVRELSCEHPDGP